MEEYVISKQDLRKWCSIPVDELATHPERKMDLMMKLCSRKKSEI